jgi:tRNA (guanine26-N2/guanine27-N2)-dimethyltransferase
VPGPGPRARSAIFYNPAMAADRDIAVAFARAWRGDAAPDRDGWEVLAATGVRGLRLLHEGGVFRSMRLTEAHPAAAELLRSNAARFAGAVVEQRDAHRPSDATFDYVDLDPYGSPAPFLEALLPSVRPGGVLAVTATDMMVLAGVQPGASERRYGARPVRGRLGPEGGLRILIGYVARCARRSGRRARPLLAYCRDHYVRAYLEVAPADEDPDPVAEIDPRSWTGPELEGAGPFGPLWCGPLFDPGIVGRLAPPPTAAVPVATGRFIERVREELGADVPFFFEANSLAERLGLASPPPLAALFDAIRREGFRAARTHARPEGFRTTAPRRAVQRIASTLAGQSQNARVRA